MHGVELTVSPAQGAHTRICLVRPFAFAAARLALRAPKAAWAGPPTGLRVSVFLCFLQAGWQHGDDQ